MTEKERRQVEFFRNRILKNERILRKWLKREAISAYRLYDRDIPEIPLSLDIYRGTAVGAEEEREALFLALYERPYEKDPAEESRWFTLMADTAADALGIPRSLVFARTRRRQRGVNQYVRVGTGQNEWIIREGGLSFIVNLSDYLDTGLFLDHRPLRGFVRQEARGKRVLNLFCYTGSFSVYAAAGAAIEVSSIDLSNTYLAWAERNLGLNGFRGEGVELIRADVPSFLRTARREGRSWDLIIADPPTFSNSKAATADFDVNRDWSSLIEDCLAVLAPGGRLFFSTNSRRLVWEASRLSESWEDISTTSIPPDFRDKKIHRAWRIVKGR